MCIQRYLGDMHHFKTSKFLSATQQSERFRCSEEDNITSMRASRMMLNKTVMLLIHQKKRSLIIGKNVNWKETNRLISPHLHRNGKGGMLLPYYKLSNTENNEKFYSRGQSYSKNKQKKSNSQVMKFLIVYNHCGLRVTKKVGSVKYDFSFSLSF